MGRARNKVIDGEFKGKIIICACGSAYIVVNDSFRGKRKYVYLDYNTVANYKLIDQSSEVSRASALTRSIAGQVIAGDAGGLAGAMSAKVHDTNIVLITYRDNRRSLIEINETVYKCLKNKCKYNINIEKKPHKDDNFNIYKEIVCPHCGNIEYGAVDEKCKFCRRPYSMPKKEWRKIDIITIPFLIFLFPVGLVMMWVNESYYLKTRIQISVLWGIMIIFSLYVGFYVQ